jgi:cephalosporin-C deacetylase
MTTTPDGFDAYWDAIDEGLSAIPAAPESEALPLHSTDVSTTYRVKLTGLGRYRFNVFLSIPDGPGPFPALMLVPGYGSVVVPPSYDDRVRYVAMAVRHRGTRGADMPYAARYPGLLTDGIADPQAWQFRGILADLLRAFEYLVGLPMVDPGRIAINGSDAGVIVAARRPQATSVAVTTPFFTRLAEHYPTTEAYPFEEINDHLRAYPGDQPSIDATLALFDPVHHAPRVTCPALVSIGDPGGFGGPEWMAPLLDGLGGGVERHQMTHEGQTDYDAIDRWLATRQGVAPRPRTWVPQDIGPWAVSGSR